MNNELMLTLLNQAGYKQSKNRSLWTNDEKMMSFSHESLFGSKNIPVSDNCFLEESARILSFIESRFSDIQKSRSMDDMYQRLYVLDFIKDYFTKVSTTQKIKVVDAHDICNNLGKVINDLESFKRYGVQSSICQRCIDILESIKQKL